MRITHSFQRLVEAITQSSLIATLHYFSTFYPKKYVLSRAKYTYILCIYSLFYEQSKKRQKLSFSLRRFRSIAVKRHSHTHTRHKRVHYRKTNNKAPSCQQNSTKRICFRLSSVQHIFLKLLRLSAHRRIRFLSGRNGFAAQTEAILRPPCSIRSNIPEARGNNP